MDITAFLTRATVALLATQRHNWEHGTAMQAFLEAGRMDVVIPMAREAVYRQLPDGRPAGMEPLDGVVDPCACGEGILRAWQETGDELLEKGLQNLKQWVWEKAPRNAQGVLYHLEQSCQFWSDSPYMLPPFLAAVGDIDGALLHMDAYWQALYDPTAGVMRHIWDDKSGTYPDASHWGTGSGWTMAGLLRTASLLPEGREKDRDRLRQMARTLLDGVLPYRCTDGSFRNVVDDPHSFSEWNLSQMTAYVIYRGVGEGWLPETYITEAELMRKGAMAHTDAYGFIFPVCGAPTFDKPGVSPEAQAFSFMMATAWQAHENKKAIK